MRTTLTKSRKSPKPTAPASNPAYATGKPPHGSSSNGGSESEGSGSSGEAPSSGSTSKGGSETQGGPHNHGGRINYTTSTVYATQTKTIVSSGSTTYTTVIVPISTTVCPVSEINSASGHPAVSTVPTKTGKNPGYPMSTGDGMTGSPTISKGHPTAPATVGFCDIVGCFGSTDDFAGFSLVEKSAKMSVEICTSECIASGFPYSGLHEA
jgi:hypothetical protein